MRKPKKSTDLCIGCYNNFYNGNNPYGVAQCWSYPKAVVEKRLLVSIHQTPPYNAKLAAWYLSCFRRQGYAAVRPDALTKEGYWKS